MAIVISGVTTCRICGFAVENETGYFATTAFLGDSHRLWPFSDAAMHWPCYASWPDRAEFAKLYSDANARAQAGNPHWQEVLDNAAIRVSVSSAGIVRVLLKNLAHNISVPINELDSWIADPKTGNSFVDAELDRSKLSLQSLESAQHVRQVAASTFGRTAG
jgi:hypothetical protein